MHAGDIVMYTGRTLYSMGQRVGEAGARRFMVALCVCELCTSGRFVAVEPCDSTEPTGRHVARAAVRVVGHECWRDELRAADTDADTAAVQRGIRRGFRKPQAWRPKVSGIERE